MLHVFGWSSCIRYPKRMSAAHAYELPEEQALTDAVSDAIQGKTAYLTQHGQRVAAVVSLHTASAVEAVESANTRTVTEVLAAAAEARERTATVLAEGQRLRATMTPEQLRTARLHTSRPSEADYRRALDSVGLPPDEAADHVAADERLLPVGTDETPQ